jgi:tetratricopeptide (TPR) repeat protein
MEAIEACLGEVRTLQKEGQPEEACARLEQELARHRAEEDSTLSALLCTELAQLHMHSGDVLKAQPLFQRALAIREQSDSAQRCVRPL